MSYRTRWRPGSATPSSGSARAVATLKLALSVPLDLPASLDSGQAFRWRLHDGWWWGSIGETAYRLCIVGDSLEFDFAPDNDDTAGKRLADYLGFDEDTDAISTALVDDAYLTSALEQFPGIRILRQDPWECLVSFICSAQCSIARIRRMTDALSRGHGRPIELEGRTMWTFPTPQALARAGESNLRELGLGFRAPSVVIAAQSVATGDLDLTSLRDASYADAYEALLAIPGVGPKIASCVLLFSLGKGNAFPVDRWVRRAAIRVYGLPEKTKDAAITAWAEERFGQNAGYAQQLLFHAERARG